jgi:protocatechuate 3,4-dioxygenase beta subunit
MVSRNDRRNFLTRGAVGAGALLLATPAARALAASCGLTPPQTSGPFYPGESQFHPDQDLTQIPGRPAALGEVVIVQGQVLDTECRPIAGAAIEIWQACASGRYNNPKDPNTAAALDPNFKYWGEAFTDEHGNYSFKTIIPGAYPADLDWDRPPHIHFKISKLGYRELTTQLYFAGQPLNDRDLILLDLAPADRERVIVSFAGGVGKFDITLRRVDGRVRLPRSS